MHAVPKSKTPKNSMHFNRQLFHVYFFVLSGNLTCYLLIISAITIGFNDNTFKIIN